MATVNWDAAGLQVQLGRWERFGTFQRDFTVPWEHVDSAEQVRDLWPHLRGWRWPGIGVPHVVLIGRMRSRDGNDFAAVYKSQPGIIIGLHDEEYARLVLSLPGDTASALVKRVTNGA